MRITALAIANSIAAAVMATGCSKDISYSADIQPILNASCLECHDGKGQGSQESGLVLVDYDDLMQGTKLGRVVVPGESVSSNLYRLVSHKGDPSIHMPPHPPSSAAAIAVPSLTDEQIETIKTWIDQGAKNN